MHKRKKTNRTSDIIKRITIFAQIKLNILQDEKDYELGTCRSPNH